MKKAYDYPGEVLRIATEMDGRVFYTLIPKQGVEYVRNHPGTPILDDNFLKRLVFLLNRRPYDEDWLLLQLSAHWEDIEPEGLGHALDIIFLNHPSNQTPKVGRNELCPCGSGRKYKRCCL